MNTSGIFQNQSQKTGIGRNFLKSKPSLEWTNEELDLLMVLNGKFKVLLEKWSNIQNFFFLKQVNIFFFLKKKLTNNQYMGSNM